MKQEGQKVEREDTLVFVLVEYVKFAHVCVCVFVLQIHKHKHKCKKTEDGQSRRWIDETPASKSNFIYVKRKKLSLFSKRVDTTKD